MSSDWETRALEAEARLEEQEAKSKQLVELVKKQKADWESRVEYAEAESERWKEEAEKAKNELVLKSDQLANVSYRLDSLIALNEKNAKDNPDSNRLKELEDRLALHQDAAQTHKAQVAMQRDDYTDKIRKLELELSLKEREIQSLKEELSVSHERAFNAEGRLGREQALSRDLSSQLNQLRYGTGGKREATGTSTSQAKAAPITQQESAAMRTELDDLSLDDLSLDLDLPDHTTTATVAVAPAKTTSATSAPPKASPARPKGAAPKKPKPAWDDIDAMLDDIQSTSGKKSN